MAKKRTNSRLENGLGSDKVCPKCGKRYLEKKTRANGDVVYNHKLEVGFIGATEVKEQCLVKAALGISDEPQPSVAVETPAAQDSDYQPMVGDDVSIKYTTDTYHGIVRDVTSDSISIVRYNQTILSFLLNDVIVTLVSRPTSATVAINDDSAVNTTPSEQKANDGQPSGSEPVLSVAAYDALLYIYNVERGLISVQACDSLTRAGLITPICMQGSQWLVKSNDAGREYVEKYLLAKEAQPVSGWVADALQSVNVTSEAAANDEYLPPTVEDNDDLPFSDLGEDDTPNWTSIDGDIIDSQRERIYELEAQNWQRNETIASLEARVLSLEYALARIAEYGWTEHLMDDILKMQQIAVKAIAKQTVS